MDKYIKNAKKNIQSTFKERDKFYKRKLGDFGLSNHSVSINHDPEVKNFADFCGNCSYDFLDWSGFDLKHYKFPDTEMWVQEFSRKGGGHHNSHIHWNTHVTGF